MLGAVAAGATILVCLRKGLFSRYLILNTYLLGTLAFILGCFYVRSVYQYESPHYFYFYFTGDAFLSVISYLLVGSFFDQMLRHSLFHRYIRPVLGLIFLVVIAVTGLFISRNVDYLYGRFVVELQQNMYFVGVLLTFLLRIAMSYLQDFSRRFVLLVSGIGVLYGAHAATYALVLLGGKRVEFATSIIPLAYTLMVFLWLYTFVRVPEGEPMAAPARVRPRESVVEARL